MIRTAIFALVAGTVTAGATFAQNAPEVAEGNKPLNPILRLDQDGDGQISRQEAQVMGQNPMARADANGDGTVSREEVIRLAVERATERATRRAGDTFDRFDEDGNGEIATENLPEPRGHHGDRAGQLFERFDANDDGTLSADEISEIAAMGPRGHHGFDGHDGHGKRGRGENGRG